MGKTRIGIIGGAAVSAEIAAMLGNDIEIVDIPDERELATCPTAPPPCYKAQPAYEYKEIQDWQRSGKRRMPKPR